MFMQWYMIKYYINENYSFNSSYCDTKSIAFFLIKITLKIEACSENKMRVYFLVVEKFLVQVLGIIFKFLWTILRVSISPITLCFNSYCKSYFDVFIVSMLYLLLFAGMCTSQIEGYTCDQPTFYFQRAMGTFQTFRWWQTQTEGELILLEIHVSVIDSQYPFLGFSRMYEMKV